MASIIGKILFRFLRCKFFISFKLRDSQTDCTDSDCMTSLPEVSGSGIGGNMMLIAILWGILAMVMFFFRPSSMRSDSSAQNQGQLEGKPLSSGGVS